MQQPFDETAEQQREQRLRQAQVLELTGGPRIEPENPLARPVKEAKETPEHFAARARGWLLRHGGRE